MIDTESSRTSFAVKADDGHLLSVIEPVDDLGAPAPAVLLVHGSGCGFEYWDVPVAEHSIMAGLAKAGIAAYAVQCRGYGASGRPPGMTVTANRMASDVAAVVNAIAARRGGGTVGLAGHSSGASVALLAARSAPVSRLALCAVHYRRINPRFRSYAEMMVRQAEESGTDYVANRHYRDIETRLDDHDPDVVAWYKHLIESRYPEIPGAVFLDVVKGTLEQAVAETDVPTLVLNGTRDYVIDSDDAFELFRDLGCAQKAFMTLPGSYHLPFLERRGHAGVISALRYWFRPQFT